MNNNIEILEAEEADAQAVADIQSQTWLCAYPRPQLGIFKEDIKAKVDEFNRQGVGRIIKEMQKEGAKTWVAKQKDKIVGFVGVLKGENENIITALHILPEFQGKGIGTKLLQTALDWLGNLKKITIEVVNYNEQAIEFYEKFGFKNTEEIVEDEIQLPNGKSIQKVLMVRATDN